MPISSPHCPHSRSRPTARRAPARALALHRLNAIRAPRNSQSPQHGDCILCTPRKSQSPQHGELRIAYDYDARGNLLRKTEAVGQPEARITETTRDAFGHATSETRKGGAVTLPNGTSLAIPDAVTSTQNDLAGNAVRVTDAENAITRMKHDLVGNFVELTDPRNHVWKATCDPKGRLPTRTNPLDKGLDSFDPTSWHNCVLFTGVRRSTERHSV